MFLGIDLGTTNVKAVLCEAGGAVVGRGSAPLQLIHIGAVGIEQDIEEIRAATVSVVRAALAGARAGDVRAVGVSAQGGAMQLVDPDGRPIERVISWMDGRGRPYGAALTARLGSEWFAERTRHGAGLAVGQLLRLREERPDLMAPGPSARAYRIGFVGDVIVRGLCGRAAHDATSLALTLLHNPSLGTADPDLLRELDLTEADLPDLLPAREPAGPLTTETARATSLPAGIPVSPAIHDQYAASLGCGAVNAGDVMFGAGTAWVLLAVSDELTQPVTPGAFICTHVVDGLCGQIVSMVNGGSSFDWARGLMGLADAGPRQLDSLLAGVRPGAEGARFLPLLAPGGGSGLAGGTNGRLSGLRLSHRPAHVLRAVVEGLCLELTRYLRIVTDAGIAVDRLVMCGGAAAGRVTPQILADATGVPVACCTETDTSAFGAAVLARALVEPDADLAALSREMSPASKAFEPGPDKGVYREMFEEYTESLPTGD